MWDSIYIGLMGVGRSMPTMGSISYDSIIDLTKAKETKHHDLFLDFRCNVNNCFKLQQPHIFAMFNGTL